MQNSVSDESLVDIRDVSVKRDLPQRERIADYVRQIKNPYRFRCGGFIVNVRFAEGGPALDDCLQRIIS
jgi:hypothetical protein